MNLLELLRNKAFWGIDFLKGKHIRKYYNTLKLIESGNPTSRELAEYQNKSLQELLTHAKKTVPFYKSITSNQLNDFPVVNKIDIRSNYDDFLSSNYLKSELITMSTSGSTGTPFLCYQDANKKKHVNAETIYYNGKIGYQMGKRIIYFRSIVSEVSKTKLQQFMQNIYLLDCNDLSDNAIYNNLKKIANMTKHSGAMIMGYASTMDAFAKYIENNGCEWISKCNIYGIVSGSEMLKDQTRDILEKAFNCKCVSRYANEENGFLGQDSDVNNEFYQNRADYFFEILKMDSDEPVIENEVGRIVVTDYFNYAMPMIRYDTGDVGSWKHINIDGVQRDIIASFGGRKVDQIYDCYGNYLSPHSITNLMWTYNKVMQYQFVQEDLGKYRMILNVNNDWSDEDSLKADLKNILKNQAVIAFEYVDEIPVLNSGKRRYIVNKMN